MAARCVQQMPQRAKSRLSGPKKRRGVHLSAAPAAADSDDAAPDGTLRGCIAEPDNAATLEPAVSSRRFAAARLENYAMLGWAHNYERLFLLEAEANSAHEYVGEYVSNYRQRQIAAGGTTAARAVDRSSMRISHDFERLRRERCMHHIPFSQVVKGASMLVDQVLPILFRMLVCSCSQFVLC